MSNEYDELQAKLCRVIQIQAEIEVRKLLYAELDKLVLELHAAGFVQGVVGELAVELVDNFASGNTQFRTAGVHRWEIKPVPKKRIK